MDKKMLSRLNLADYVSIFRICAAPVLIVLAAYDLRSWFSWLLVLGLVSDALDGWIARNITTPTKHGAQLDSIGDALIFLTAATALILLFEPDFFRQYMIPLAFALGLYLLQLVLALFRYRRPSSFHTYSAKTSAIINGIFLVSTSFLGPLEWLFYIAIGISILESIEEIVLLFIFKEPVTDVKGLYWVKKEGKENFTK